MYAPQKKITNLIKKKKIIEPRHEMILEPVYLFYERLFFTRLSVK